MKTTTHIPEQMPENPAEFFRGWWHAAPVFFVIGLAGGVVLAGFIK